MNTLDLIIKQQIKENNKNISTDYVDNKLLLELEKDSNYIYLRDWWSRNLKQGVILNKVGEVLSYIIIKKYQKIANIQNIEDLINFSDTQKI
jgi:capsid protein